MKRTHNKGFVERVNMANSSTWRFSVCGFSKVSKSLVYDTFTSPVILSCLIYPEMNEERGHENHMEQRSCVHARPSRQNLTSPQQCMSQDSHVSAKKAHSVLIVVSNLLVFCQDFLKGVHV